MTGSDTSTDGTVRFESPGQLARHLFDRAVKPEHDGRTRLLLAIYSALYVKENWRELQTDTERMGGE